MQPKDTGGKDAIPPIAWYYELVPLLELPEVDLSKSVKAQLPRARILIHVLDQLIKHSVSLFFAFLAFLAVAIAVLFVHAPLGRTLSIISAVLGMPSVIVCFSMLRYDIVVILIKTYDVWFFGVTSTLVATATSLLFHDQRSVFVLVSWLAFFMGIFVDANLFAIRNVWIASAISAACYVILAGTITIGCIDELKHVNLLSTNGHVLPANAVVRDGVATMVVLILRNLSRRYHHAIKKQRLSAGTSVFVVRCVTFRCRLQYRELPAVPVTEAVNPHTTAHNEPPNTAARMAQSSTRVRLRFDPFLGPIDARQTIIPIPWFWRVDPQKNGWWTRCRQRGFRVLGVVGFFIPNAVIVSSLLSPSSVNQASIIAVVTALSLSIVFVGACLVTVHRRLLLALITSFDFVYIAFQGVMIHLTLADLCKWKADITLALLSDLLWSTWMMCWDAVPPPARKRLGVTSGFAAYIGTGLVAVINVYAVTLVVFLPPSAINDHALFGVDVLGSRFEFFVLTWYLSCATTIVSWAIRIMWRLWRATETELVVLDGPVFFEKPLHRRETRKYTLKRNQVANISGTCDTAIFPANP